MPVFMAFMGQNLITVNEVTIWIIYPSNTNCIFLQLFLPVLYHNTGRTRWGWWWEPLQPDLGDVSPD